MEILHVEKVFPTSAPTSAWAQKDCKQLFPFLFSVYAMHPFLAEWTIALGQNSMSFLTPLFCSAIRFCG